MRSFAGLLAFGLLFPSGMAAAAPEDPAPIDEVVVDGLDAAGSTSGTSEVPDMSTPGSEPDVIAAPEAEAQDDVLETALPEAMADPGADGAVASNDGVSASNMDSTAPKGLAEPASNVVTFQDSALKECIANELRVRADSQITKANLLNLTGLSCGNNGSEKIVNIEPLAYATNLSDLRLHGQSVSDVSPLAGLTRLTGLDLGENRVSDVSPLSDLWGLSWLDLSGNRVSDISSLAGLTGLRSLLLRNNAIQDVSALSSLTDLENLYLDGNKIRHVSSLSNIPGLQSLYLNNNQISDVSPLSGLAGLGWLDLSGNQLSDISPLASLNNLESVNVDGQRISLPDVASGKASDLPVVRFTSGAGISLTVSSGTGKVAGNSVTWNMPDGGQASLTWSKDTTIGRANSVFSGTISQKVLPATSVPTLPVSGDHVVLRSGNLYAARYALSSGSYDVQIRYGRADDVTFFGDWDGDGVDGIAVRRANTYFFKDVIGPGPADREIAYGRPDDDVLVGDWDGDGKDTLAVRRGNTYFFKNKISGGAADKQITYGRPDDVVLVGDWDGDGKDTLAIRRGNTYYIKNEISGGSADNEVIYGRADDEVLVGDWNKDRIDTLMVRRGNKFYATNNLKTGDTAVTFSLGTGKEAAYAARLK